MNLIVVLLQFELSAARNSVSIAERTLDYTSCRFRSRWDWEAVTCGIEHEKSTMRCLEARIDETPRLTGNSRDMRLSSSESPRKC